jgi:dinuclear metal center YbgI/SA1388 family protein
VPAPTPSDLAAAVTAYVDPHGIPDYAVTGLQVGGTRPIRRLALAESANLQSFAAAAAWDADAVLVHHGLFWASDDPDNDPARPFDERRAAFLRDRGMSLLAYHLPLDAHPEVGNNAEIARRLGLVRPSFDFAALPDGGPAIGLEAEADPPVPLGAFLDRAAAAFGQAPLVVPAGPDPIRTVAVLSGGGAGNLYEALARGVDAYVTGEGREWVPAVATEGGLTFVAVGHHASETFGVQALGGWIASRFGVEVRFFPQENPY